MNSRPTKQLTGLFLILAFVVIPLAALSAGAAGRAAPPQSPTPALRASGRIAFKHLENFFDGEDIYTVNPDGTGRARLISLFGRQEDPAWSPDGKYIAYASGHLGFGEIYRADADGSNRMSISDGIAVGAVDDYPAWSPDGTQLVFVRNRQLWTIGKDGGTAVKLSTGSDEDEQPSWSPDGTKIIFVRNYSSANAQVWVMNVDGTGQANLSNYEFGPDRTPAFSPDGSKIAFQRWNDIWLMNPDGTNQTQITFAASGGYWKPSWSPDGTRIVVTNGLNFEGEIFVMNADGANITKIADGVHPSWQSLPPLSLTVADSPDPVNAGDNLTYTLKVVNNHTLTATGATLTDALDAGTTFVSADASQGSCSANGAAVTCALGDLAAGGQATVTLVVNVAAAEGATLQNAATAAADYAGYGQQTQSAETSTQVFQPNADVAIFKGGPGVAQAGAQASYFLSVNNNGPERAENVTVTDVLPEGVTFQSATPSKGSCTTPPAGVRGTVTCTMDGLDQGEGQYIFLTVNVVAPVGTTIENTATIASASDDPDPTSNSSTATITVVPPTSDVYVGASLEGGAYVPTGGQFVYNVNVSNAGPDTAHGLTLTSQLPDGVTVDSIDGGGGACTTAAGGASFTCTFASLGLYESRTVLVTAASNVAGAPYTGVTTSFTVASATADDALYNNTGTIDFLVASPPLPTPTPGPADEAQLAYTIRPPDSGQMDIFRQRADGAQLLNLTNEPGNFNKYVWSPDGTKLAFQRYYSPNNTDIFVMDADGANPVRLTNTADEYDADIAWSPDGTRVYFSSLSSDAARRSIGVVNADGTGLTRLTDPTLSVSGPVVSPDGAHVSFVRGDQDPSDGGYRQTIYVMDADGSNQTAVTHPVSGEFDASQTWTADGSLLAFARLHSGGQPGSDLYVVRVDGTGLRALTNDQTGISYNPQWSPDASKITFQTALPDGSTALNVINADGAGRTQLYSAANNYIIETWSPDGTQLALTMNQAEQFGIYIVNADGSNLRHVGNDIEANQHPAWSPDGTRIAFNSARNGVESIDIVGADGTGRAVLTTAPGSYGAPKWRPGAATVPAPDVYVVGGIFDSSYVPTGGHVVYGVTINNVGTLPAAGVTLTASFPAGVTLDSIDDAGGGSCAAAAGGAGFTCTFASVGVFEGHDLRVTATSNVAGAPYTPVSATFNVVSTTPENNTFNNTSTADFFIAAPPLPTPTPGATDDALLAFGKQPQSTNQHDIYRQRADGAGAVNLTDNAAYDDNFAWSPDGSRLAFLRFDFANQIVSLGTVAADGSGLTLLTGVTGEQIDNYSWSPDGSRFVFSTRPYFPDDPNVGDVFVMNADGTGRTSLTNGDGYNSDPSWSPDGTRVVYVRAIFDGGGVVSSAIRIVGADGSGRSQLPQAAGEFDSLPRWSPGGARLAFTRRLADFSSYIQTAAADGTDPLRLTNDASYNDSNAQWSPDGSKLSFDSNGSAAGIASKLGVVNADGSGRTTIYEAPSDASSYNNGSQRWSPDGSRLVFQICGGECAGSSLYVVVADGTGRVELGLSAEQNGNADWSPGGSRLAFTTNRNGVNRINIINADGTGRVELPGEAAFYGAPKWRPAAQPSGDTPAGANVTVAENGVAVTFSNVTTAGETTVTPIDPNSLQGLPGEYVINANSLAFEIHTTAAYTGPITLGFQVPGINNPITFSALRVLHGEPPPVPNFVDRTVLAPDSPAPSFPTRTVYARVNSLSPFVVTQLADTTGPEIQITSPAAQAYVVRQAVAASYTCTDAGSGVLSCTGTVPNGAAVNTATVGSKTFAVNATDNAGNTSAKSVAYKVAYGVTPTYDQTKVHKSGSTVHLSLRLVDALGANLSAAGVGISTLNIALVSSSSSGPVEEYSDDDPDANFVYKNGEYSFKLKTTGYAAGTYLLSFRAGSDPTVHTIEFRIRQ